MWHVYYRSWLRWRKRPGQWLDADSARYRHEHRKSYTVLFADNIRPAVVLDLRADAVRIALMDYHLREWMVGLFEVFDGDRLFLTEANYQTFRGKSDAFALQETHRFQEDGTVVKEERHFQTGHAAPRTITMDVSRNWEPYPSFGDYESILALYWADKLRAV